MPMDWWKISTFSGLILITLAAHFSLLRIAALFDDLDPAAGQVTWQGVPESAIANANSFQIELFFDGRIRITWLGSAATDSRAGLSRGTGLPNRISRATISVHRRMLCTC